MLSAHDKQVRSRGCSGAAGQSAPGGSAVARSRPAAAVVTPSCAQDLLRCQQRRRPRTVRGGDDARIPRRTGHAAGRAEIRSQQGDPRPRGRVGNADLAGAPAGGGASGPGLVRVPSGGGPRRGPAGLRGAVGGRADAPHGRPDSLRRLHRGTGRACAARGEARVDSRRRALPHAAGLARVRGQRGLPPPAGEGARGARLGGGTVRRGDARKIGIRGKDWPGAAHSGAAEEVAGIARADLADRTAFVQKHGRLAATAFLRRLPADVTVEPCAYPQEDERGSLVKGASAACPVSARGRSLRMQLEQHGFQSRVAAVRPSLEELSWEGE